jgi:hypothetical protein
MKNLVFFFSSQKIKKGDPSDIRPQDDKERQIYKNFETVSVMSERVKN